eukprot:360627-Chlamydomonas_euryale.AAC.4
MAQAVKPVQATRHQAHRHQTNPLHRQVAAVPKNVQRGPTHGIAMRKRRHVRSTMMTALSATMTTSWLPSSRQMKGSCRGVSMATRARVVR